MHKLKQYILASPDLRGLLLVVLTGGWLAGISLNAWLVLSPAILLTVGMCTLFLVYLCWRSQPLLRLSGLVLLCFCLGAWRYASVSPVNDAQAIRTLIGSPALQVQGDVADDPRLESHSTLLMVNTQRLSLDNGQHWQEAHGQIQIQALGAIFDDPYAPRYGDTLSLEGKLTTPPGYATPELQASMAFPKMSITSRNGNPLLVQLHQTRTDLAGILLQALPQPYAALLIAIFLSLRTPALKPWLVLFNVTGTAHLVAPSGFKVTLLAGFIGSSTRWIAPRGKPQDRGILPAARRRGDWRRWLHTLLLILCIALYTILSGSGPAAIRAGIMGILLILAPRLKRAYNVYTALALTALLMSLVDPFVLWDTGFLLSFSGTLGIVLLTPFLQHPLRFLDRFPLGSQIAEIVAVTLAAQIATLPIFALSFQQISFIAPLANLASVPLLGILLALGTLICLSGLLVPPLAPICGWLAWPLLWYTTQVISWCAHLPGAYLLVDNLSPLVAWIYYAFLAWLIALLLVRQRPTENEQRQHSPALTPRVKLTIQASLALLTILSTSLLILLTPHTKSLTITLLSTGDPGQGQALLLHTPDGQTALINEGAGSATLAQTLDTRLPFWQRSLGLVLLSDTSTANLAGLQDVITRYQVQQVADPGMLHPSLAYAQWRNTLDTRNLAYTRLRQGTSIALGQEVSLQVLWPPALLHKSSNETHDNALILLLLAPGLRLLLLNSASLSNYALQTLPLTIAASKMHAEIVQFASEPGKALPTALANVLALAHPSLLLMTNIPARQHTNTAQSANTTSTASPPAGPWETLSGTQFSSLELQSSGYGWNIYSSE